MKQKPRFVTIFTEAENFHLVKDVGQIPYFMYKTEGYEGELVTYQNEPDYPFLKDEVKGLKLTFIPNKGKLFLVEWSVIQYLLQNSKGIDVLNLFHFKRENIIYLLIYKFLHPKGKAYIKLDMSILFFRNYNSFFFSNFKLKNYLLNVLAKWIFRLTDLFSVETEDARDYLSRVYPELKDKLIFIPNGVDSKFLDKEIELKTFEEKENIIITVGRIGTHQKNTELLLDALKVTNLKDWKVCILGEISDNFKEYIRRYFEEFPQLEDSVIFLGNVTDRRELFSWYNRAKLFCLTSRWEGFPIVFSEALHFGNYIITTPVSSAEQITKNGQYGTIVNADVQELSKEIQNCMEDSFLNAERFEEIKSYSEENYTWSGIIKKLSNKLNS